MCCTYMFNDIKCKYNISYDRMTLIKLRKTKFFHAIEMFNIPNQYLIMTEKLKNFC